MSPYGEIMMSILKFIGFCLGTLVLLACTQQSMEHHHPGHGEIGNYGGWSSQPSAAYIDREPPLYDNLGTLHFRVTTRNQLAQDYFDQGLRLAYAFNHAEARRAFRMAQKLDHECAMCYWGEALVLGPNINAPMDYAALAPALKTLHKATLTSKNATPREQALINALAQRYSDDPRAERPGLDSAYAKAMSQVYKRFPSDPEAAVLYAESLMDLTPWNYWEDGGQQPKGQTTEIINTLEKVLANHPNHPGAIHYYIHMVEASSKPERAEPYARRLGALMPGAGHLVHMPFHTYFRLGLYLDALAVNKAAVSADENFIAKAKPEGIYTEGYYPHNVHSLMVSAQMAGDGETALAAAEKLAQVATRQASRNTPWIQPIQASPYLTHAQFSSPTTVLALSDPGNEFPYVKAMWHYARGVASATQGDAAAAFKEAEAIVKLRQVSDFSRLTSGGIPAPDILELARHIVLGRIAENKGDFKTACAEFEQAVALQDKLPYFEPPHWYYPVRQSLGAAFFFSGDLGRAEKAFRTSLVERPNNGWALYGLLNIHKKRGDKSAAKEIERRLAQTWAGDRNILDLRRL